jgi:hypothetical protein
VINRIDGRVVCLDRLELFVCQNLVEDTLRRLWPVGSGAGST